MAFDVKYSDIQQIQNDLATKFVPNLDGSSQELNENLATLVNMSSFQGLAAESIKNYFYVHQLMGRTLNMMAHQLSTEFADKYYNHFRDGSICETHEDAEWPSEVMKTVEDKLNSVCTGPLTCADAELRRAMAALPQGVSFDFPNSASTQEPIEGQKELTGKVREAVREAENTATAAFTSSSGEYADLSAGLGAMMSACTSGAISLVACDTKAVTSLIQSTGLGDALDAAAKYQEEKQDVVIACQKDSIQMEQVRIQKQQEEEAKKKAFWSAVGTIASVAVAVASAAAFIGTAGTAGPLLLALNAYSLGAATVDVIDRGLQTYDVASGKDIAADKGDHKNEFGNAFFGDIAKEGTGLTNNVRKTVKTYGDYKEAVRDNLSYRATEKSYNLVADSGGMIINEAFDIVGDNIDSSEGKTAVKITKEVTNAVYKHKTNISYKTPDVPKGFGIASTAGKVTTAVSDYFVGEHDNNIDKLQDRSDALERASNNLGSSSSYDWGLSW